MSSLIIRISASLNPLRSRGERLVETGDILVVVGEGIETLIALHLAQMKAVKIILLEKKELVR